MIRSKRRISDQFIRVDKLRQDGHDTTAAEAFVARLEKSLDAPHPTDLAGIGPKMNFGPILEWQLGTVVETGGNSPRETLVSTGQ